MKMQGAESAEGFAQAAGLVGWHGLPLGDEGEGHGPQSTP